jgi:hypothetical protein
VEHQGYFYLHHKSAPYFTVAKKIIMSDTAVVVVEKGKGYLKWSPKMKLNLVKAVKANKAHIKTKRLQFRGKYVKVIGDLWSREEFNEQCEKQRWATVEKMFRSLCDKFSSVHGYGENGMRINLSALPDMDELSEMDELLHDMCEELPVRRRKWIRRRK